MIIELKMSNNRNKRVNRQEAEAQKVLEYLETSRTESLYQEGWLMVRMALHVPERHYIEELNSVISQALTQGFGFAQLEEGLYYYVEFEPNFERFQALLKSIRGEMAVAYVNMYKHQFPGYYPFTLSIYDPEILFNFYLGEVSIFVLFDTQILIKRFLEYGVQVEFLQDETYGMRLTPLDAATSKHGPLSVTRLFWGRMPCEFLSLHWFVEELAHRAHVGSLAGLEGLDQSTSSTDPTPFTTKLTTAE
jgi:hypothetical protein